MFIVGFEEIVQAAQMVEYVDVDNMMLGEIEARESGMVTFEIMPDIGEVGIGEMIPVPCSEGNILVCQIHVIHSNLSVPGHQVSAMLAED